MMKNLKAQLLSIAVGSALALSSVHVLADEFATAAELGLMEGFPPTADKMVDKSNALFTPPFNRWSYLNMRSIYPSTGIENAEHPTAISKEIDKSIDGLSVAKAGENGLPNGETVNMQTYFKETYTDALVVVKGNKVVYEHYDNGMNADQPHQMMSVTKSFAGLFGLMAVEDGKAKESDLVTGLLPSLKASTGFSNATFGQVLNMTNSVDFSEDYADPNSGIVQYGKVLGLIESGQDEKLADSIYEFLPSLAKDSKHEHGDIFHYQTPKTDVVNWFTNAATQVSFQDNLSERLWKKLGTDGETYVLLDKNGTLFAGGGLNATPNDLSRFAMMMLNDGEFNGEQVVSKNTIDKLAEGGDQQAFANGTESHGIMGEEPWSYRAQWWVRHAEGKESFNAIGVHGQWIYIDRERDIAIIKQSSQPVSSNDYFDGYNINAYDAIIEHLTQ